MKSCIPITGAQLLYGTGMRVSEVLTPRVKDIDFYRHALTCYPAQAVGKPGGFQRAHRSSVRI